jgi:LytS/YehU family sensor histidine kinase
VASLAIGLQYFKRGVINQYQLQELRTKNAIAETAALKAQLNPHFLFNTLNNIYAVNIAEPEKGSEMILELADVMRYHLQISKAQIIALAEEEQLIKSYIELEKLRINNNCKLAVNIDIDNTTARIAPLLLLPFIENAFKHGTHPVKACFINISLLVEGEDLLFEVKNSLINNKNVVKTNIGLQNTLQRLKILYPNRHEVSTNVTNGTYHTRLLIQL